MLNIKERDANTVQPPEADTKVLFLDAADSKLKLKDSTGAIEELSVDLTGIPAGGDTGDVLAKASADDEDVEWVDPTGGVKEYVALLTQSGTDAPEVIVLKNSLGGTVVWTRTGDGIFTGTLANAFPVNKCDIGNGDDDSGVFIYYNTADGFPIYLSRGNANSIVVRQYSDITLAITINNIAGYIPVKIKVYP